MPAAEHHRGTRIAVLLAIVYVAMTAACSTQSHYALLSFFFDGVPDPNAPQVDDEAASAAVRSGPLTLEERAALQKERLPQHEYSFHPPFQEKACNLCHGVQRTDSWVQGLPELVAPKEELCKRCHVVPQQEFVHGPVAAIGCYLCHEHHSSRYPHLLQTDDIASLCARCHAGETFTTQAKHTEYGDRSCIECHDPHASGERFLLRTRPDESGKEQGR